MSELTGWHFSTGRLGYGDNRPIVMGETHTVDVTERKLELCEWGLHASERIIDALRYASGPMVCRVRLHGEILRGDDKACATHRTYIDGIDATGILREFARKCALDVIHLWDAPDVVRRYLETGDELLRAASSAAALDASSAASWAASWAASSAASWDTAWDTARAAAWDTAWGQQNTRLTDMVQAAIAKAKGESA